LRATIYPRILLPTLCRIALATSASAECVWMWWQQVDSREALASSATDVGATYTTSRKCTTGINELELRWDRPQAVVMRDARTRLIVVP
jgi:hypothetical protein